MNNMVSQKIFLNDFWEFKKCNLWFLKIFRSDLVYFKYILFLNQRNYLSRFNKNYFKKLYNHIERANKDSLVCLPNKIPNSCIRLFFN